MKQNFTKQDILIFTKNTNNLLKCILKKKIKIFQILKNLSGIITII